MSEVNSLNTLLYFYIGGLNFIIMEDEKVQRLADEMMEEHPGGGWKPILIILAVFLIIYTWRHFLH